MPCNDREITGQIFDIQHYCVHDGPGIRTNVFFKGCPLRCLWCANPESQHCQRQLLFREELCVGCGACVSVCPAGAIRLEANVVRTDRNHCTQCGACEKVCKRKARSVAGKSKTAGEVVDEVMRDALFYGDDGGVTLTGGECTMQGEFALAVLRLCKEQGISTCMETCGQTSWELLQQLAAYTDTFLYDVKAVQPDAHRRFTGVPNDVILSNFERLSQETDCRLIARVPVVPGYNAGEEMAHDLGKFLQGHVKRCTEVHLLPYHNFGEGKYDQLGVQDRDFSARIPTEEEMERYRDIVRQYVPVVK